MNDPENWAEPTAYGWGRVFKLSASAPTGGYAPKTPLRPQLPAVDRDLPAVLNR